MNTLSPEELHILSEQSFYDHKNSATEKLYEMLSDTRLRFMQVIQPDQLLFPEGVDFKQGQLARGESLNGYPYVFLDFPKLYSKHNIFSFRTMVWYGHHFIFSVILAGDYLKSYQRNLKQYISEDGDKNLWLCQKGLWDWKQSHYISIHHNDAARIIKELDYLKLVRFLPLSTLQNPMQVLNESESFYRDICPMIKKLR